MNVAIGAFYYLVAGLTAWYMGSKLGLWLKEQMNKYRKIEINTREEEEDNG